MSVLEARLARRLPTVVDTTSAKHSDRAELLARARRHGVPTIALLVTTPASVCVARQQDRPANRRVPQAVVEAQHAAIVAAFPGMPSEGFDHVVFAESIDRLGPLAAPQRPPERGAGPEQRPVGGSAARTTLLQP
ncbi:AAA family ATPase [Streptomyces xantholiticus]|uniref:AAA family ATPase n=1 Tax=Streptomyces xantholiticus TaxID=68285 RepID=UPI001E5D60D8|nr:ATP-binding protein [Streptomyces xantholiticus]